MREEEMARHEAAAYHTAYMSGAGGSIGQDSCPAAMAAESQEII